MKRPRKPDPVAAALAGLLASFPSEHSRNAYAGDWERWVAWLKRQRIEVTAVRPRNVDAYASYLRGEGKARSTIGHALSVIRSVYGALVRDEVMESNPAREIKTPRSHTTPTTPWLNEEQARHLLATSANDRSWRGRRDHLVICLLFGLGKRRAEIARMRVEDFHDGAVTGIVKGAKEVTVGVPAWASKAISEWRRYAKIDAGALFPRFENSLEPMTGDMVYIAVKRVAAAAKLPRELVTPHALRRTFATILDLRGSDVRQIQTALAHDSVTTTERYQKSARSARQSPGDQLADIAGYGK